MQRALIGVAVAVTAAVAWVLLRPAPVPAGATAAFGRTVAGGPTTVIVDVRAGSRDLPAGRALRVAFPHWVYGSAGVRRPPGTVEEGWGHWAFVESLPAIREGDAHRVQLSMRLPAASGSIRLEVSLDGVPQPMPQWVLENGPAARLRVLAPSGIRPGRAFQVRTALEDASGNVLRFTSEDHPTLTDVGVTTVTRSGPEGVGEGTSEPVLVAADAPRVAWLDLHGHSGLSDGRGTPAEYFRAAREAGLDGAALSDHDWQLDDAEVVALLTATEAANEDGRFVTLPALEMNVNGHEVAYFLDPGRIAAVARGSAGGVRTIAEELAGGATATPPDVLAAYGNADLLLATHTSLASGMGTGYPLDRALPGNHLFEVYSAHGSSECDACARRVGGGALDEDERVGALWDALDAGHRFTLIAAGDSHDGRPGHTAWGAFPGGLTAVEVDSLDRGSVAAALRAGRAWATTGERTMLQTRWANDGVRARIVSAAAPEALEIVGDRAVIARIEAPVMGEWIDVELPPTAWRYARLVLPDGARAWAAAP